MDDLLSVKNLGISFGGLRAVNEFSINIKKRAALWPYRA